MTYHHLNDMERKIRIAQQVAREDFYTELAIDKSREESVCNLCGAPNQGNHESCENYENRPLPDKE